MEKNIKTKIVDTQRNNNKLPKKTRDTPKKRVKSKWQQMDLFPPVENNVHWFNH